MYGEGEVLLTSGGDVVRPWKKHFEDLLNPISTPSTEEAESVAHVLKKSGVT